jgi:hypothetical protein
VLGIELETKRQIKYNERLSRREMVFMAVIFLALLLTRLPWISAGYGLNPDSYRVITAARHIAQTGEYVYSRPPGYPLYEYLTALTVKMAPLFSNGLTSLFSCVAFLFFALILRHFSIRHYLLLASAFAMTPVVYVNSTCTIDFILAIALVLGSSYLILVRRSFLAGLCLGLAIGCRITSGAMLFPLMLYIYLEERGSTALKRCLILGATALIIGCLCFIPVVNRYGLSFFAFSDNSVYHSMKILIKRGLLDVWGLLGLLGLLGLGLISPFVFKDIKESFAQPHRRHGVVFSWLVVAIYLVAFLRLPHLAGYLIPVVPFLLLTVGLLTPPYVVRVLAVTLLLSSFLITITKSGVALSGPIWEDHWSRVSRIQETEKVIETVGHLSGSAVIVAGWKLPQIDVALNGERQNSHQYVYLIEGAETYRRFVAQGRTVYFLSGMDALNLQAQGIDLKQLGAQPLETL